MSPTVSLHLAWLQWSPPKSFNEPPSQQGHCPHSHLSPLYELEGAENEGSAELRGSFGPGFCQNHLLRGTEDRAKDWTHPLPYPDRNSWEWGPGNVKAPPRTLIEVGWVQEPPVYRSVVFKPYRMACRAGAGPLNSHL